MKIETLKKGNSLLGDIKRCDNIINSLCEGSSLTLKFTKSVDCMTSEYEIYCPSWMKDYIKECARTEKENLKRELDELKDED